MFFSIFFSQSSFITFRNLPILKVYFDVDYKSNLKRTNYYLNRLKKVAEDKNFQNKLLFAIANK